METNKKGITKLIQSGISLDWRPILIADEYLW